MPAVARLALTAVLLALVACKGAHGGQNTPEASAETSSPARSTAEIRRDGNHLVGSGSTYLLEHAHNPVDWYPWSPEALALARAEDRPIFLSIGYSSCHWCHVMEAEVFENDEVAATLNEHFVSIKVDREERPDLDAVFMASVEAMSGSGGWPMSLFLTPALEPFFGATYLPRDRFLAVARKAKKEFSSSRSDVEKRAADVARRIASEAEEGTGVTLGPSEVHAIATSALDRVDPQWGGFRGTTKFPVPVEWTFLLHAARKWGDEPITNALRTTLDAMASGGIRDPIGGGFHRYSTDPRWEVPHFEKMLYDNAQLASLYLEAGAALGERRYIAVAVDTLDFLLRDMQAPAGGFYASLDADSGGREGAYYEWTAEELRAVAGPADGEVLAHLLGVTGGRAAAVNRRASSSDVASKTGSTVVAVNALWERWRPGLLAARASRPRPHLDTKIVTAWNGLAISALVRAFDATGEARYRDAALRAADLVWRVHHQPAGGLSRASNEGRPGEKGVLEDYAFLAGGLVALFEATGRLELIDEAATLVKEATDRFAAPGGGWYDDENGATPFARTPSRDDSVEPSGSSALLHVMIALSALTLRQDLGDAVDAALAHEADGMRRRGVGAAGWLDAALLRAGPYYDVVVSADAGAGDDLENAWRALGAPWTIETRVPAAGPDPAFLERVVASTGKTAGSGRARAFVCSQGACKAPVDDPRALRARLLDGWKF
jgi:hypothetical protein